MTARQPPSSASRNSTESPSGGFVEAEPLLSATTIAKSAYERIYALVQRIPTGRVSTYGRIAIVARASGPRQVGYALHALKDGTNVPWHRVVNAAGRISVGGDSGITQRLKLHREGVELDVGGRIDLKRFGWTPGSRKRG